MEQILVTIEWKNNQSQNGIEYLKLISGYLFGVSSVVKYRAADGFEDELTDDEVLIYLQKGIVQDLIFELAPEYARHNSKIHFCLANDEVNTKFHVSLVPDQLVQKRKEFLWLQNNNPLAAVPPIIALPNFDKQLHIQAIHTLIALASITGEVASANVSAGDKDSESIHGAWHWTLPDETSGTISKVSSQCDGSFWFAEGLDSQPEQNEGDPSADFWFESFWENPLDAWLVTLKSEVEGAITADDPVNALNDLFTSQSPLTNVVCSSLGDISEIPPPLVSQVSEHSAVIMPEHENIRIGIRSPIINGHGSQLVLRSLGHVLLGHVMPGDSHSHWVSPELPENIQALSRWEQKVIKEFPEWFDFKLKRKVESLDDCTPREKVMLGLWQMIGDKLGDHQKLHDRAIEYQQAIYQRQAAERLLAQLQQYDGAMLCDGVGLGKTYVATTLITHFVNWWIDNYAGDEDPRANDPFRISILSPNSIVRTWQREAILPLAEFGVITSHIRTISHSKLSRITAVSAILEKPSANSLSDFEHLVLSDLVIVDEAHNFRSTDAKRTLVLRDLLRLQPRKDMRRRVLLLTATPINNSLDDLKQECSLLFCEGLPLSDNITPEKYRQDAKKKVIERCQKARKQGRGDITSYLVHGDRNSRFSSSNIFRTDIQFGPNIPRIADYLNEQNNLLQELQERVRLIAQNPEESPLTEDSDKEIIPRIADELLDRIVVQRSRNLCKTIEKQNNSNVELLFRPDAITPEKLDYADEYDGTEDVLASFLPLFGVENGNSAASQELSPLSLKVYMWYDISRGSKIATDPSSVVGLQRALVLKRLESSPVAFLITLLRLAVLYARRLHDLASLCTLVQVDLRSQLDSEVKDILHSFSENDLNKLLTVAGKENDQIDDFVMSMGSQYSGESDIEGISDSGDIPITMFSFLPEEEDDQSLDNREKLKRLWTLKDDLLSDFKTLLTVAPRLTDIILGDFDVKEWPKRFHAEKAEVQWPQSPTWGKRVITDSKLKRLVERLILARRQKQKIIVFSQFTDSLVYIYSVLNACRKLTLDDFEAIIDQFNVPGVTSSEIMQLLKCVEIVTGATEERDDIVNRFAPYYRIGPIPPKTKDVHSDEDMEIIESWKSSWIQAIKDPVEVIFSSDVLAEGVNLQDAAVLINWDVHWNPVRMIQRSGRIDRRLNPSVETTQDWLELSDLANSIDKELPQYYWHSHSSESPLTINMILPDALERELLLRERIATKTLAIDFTLGLEHGTGAEADWMEQYKYQGISSLNAWQKDRAIEQIASYKEKLNRYFADVSIQPGWTDELKGWFREMESEEDYPLIGSVFDMGKPDGDKTDYSRFITPFLKDDELFWLWTTENPGESILNLWIKLDGRNWPPNIRNDLPWVLNASLPVSAQHLLLSVVKVMDQKMELEELPVKSYAKQLRQGLTAFSAGYFADEKDRIIVGFKKYFIMQHQFTN
jgi:hypothetical protein